MSEKPEILFNENFLRKIVDLASPSGYEQPVQRVIMEELKPIADEIQQDVLGNVVSILKSNSSLKILLDGHVDEVGLQIRYIDEKGFIFFDALGGIDAHLTPGNRVRISTNTAEILGVIGKKAIHLQKEDDQKSIIPLSKQFIDVGARTSEEVKEMGIRIGDSIFFENYYAKIGANGDVVSRCFDDKVGAFVVYEILKRLKQQNAHEVNIYGCFSVQEEIGLRGAQVLSKRISPDFALSFDVDFAMDTPVLSAKEYGDTKLGNGPIICRGPGINKKFYDLIVETAQELNIPLQIVSETRSTGTNSDAIQIANSGVITAVISIPCRYMHSMSEIVNLYDIEHIIRLSVAVIQKIKEKNSFIPN